MPWWGWIIIGVLLLGAELFGVDAAFFLVFIGLAAIITGLIGLAGLELAMWAQWLVFAVLSIVTMVLFRRRLYQKLRSGAPGFKGGLAGESLKLEETVAPGDTCRVKYRGTTWTVVNGGTSVIEQGSNVKIARVDGLKLIVNQ